MICMVSYYIRTYIDTHVTIHSYMCIRCFRNFIIIKIIMYNLMRVKNYMQYTCLCRTVNKEKGHETVIGLNCVSPSMYTHKCALVISLVCIYVCPLGMSDTCKFDSNNKILVIMLNYAKNSYLFSYCLLQSPPHENLLL